MLTNGIPQVIHSSPIMALANSSDAAYIRERKKGRGKTLPEKRSRQIRLKEQSCQYVQAHIINPSKSSDGWMIINTHKLCKKGTFHWCFVCHFCPNDRVAAYHEKCGLEFKIPFNHFEPVKHLDAVLSPYLAHFLWHPLCTVALTNLGAQQRVFPLYYLSFSNLCAGYS